MVDSFIVQVCPELTEKFLAQFAEYKKHLLCLLHPRKVQQAQWSGRSLHKEEDIAIVRYIEQKDEGHITVAVFMVCSRAS